MSATVNVSEKEFDAVAGAVIAAYRAGRYDDVAILDKLARKINASLAHAQFNLAPGLRMASKRTWKDVPSVLEGLIPSASDAGAKRSCNSLPAKCAYDNNDFCVWCGTKRPSLSARTEET